MLIPLIFAAALHPCLAEHARYALRLAPDVTARFEPVASGPDWPANLALEVRFQRSGHVYWFLPWNGGTDGLQNLASTKDVTTPGWTPPSPDGGPRPLGDLSYLGADERYQVLDDIPRRGRPAPMHFIIPDLGDRVWHQAGTGDGAPKQFFDLVACDAP